MPSDSRPGCFLENVDRPGYGYATVGQIACGVSVGTVYVELTGLDQPSPSRLLVDPVMWIGWENVLPEHDCPHNDVPYPHRTVMLRHLGLWVHWGGLDAIVAYFKEVQDAEMG